MHKSLFTFSFFFLLSCGTSNTVVYNQIDKKPEREKAPPVQYFADCSSDGIYTKIELEESEYPQPIPGEEIWIRQVYKSLRYPAVARERGDQGIVVLDVEVDTSGKVINVEISKSVTKELDDAAMNAYVNNIKDGYYPLILNGKPCSFKFNFPVIFRFE